MPTIQIPPSALLQADKEQEEKWKEILKSMAPIYKDDPRLNLFRAIETEVERLQESQRKLSGNPHE